jgi:acetoin utilization protein AcuB
MDSRPAQTRGDVPAPRRGAVAAGRREMTVRELMRTDVPAVSSAETATFAWERMRALKVDHLVVTQDEDILGIISWHDLSGPAGGVHRRMGRQVWNVMHHGVFTAAPETTVAKAATLMRVRRVGCLPVVEGRRLVGIVTISEMLRLLSGGAAPRALHPRVAAAVPVERRPASR